MCVATGAEVFAAAQDWVVDAGRAGDKVPADDVAKAHRAWAGCRAVGGVDRRDGRPRQGQLCDRVVSRRPGKAVVARIGSIQRRADSLDVDVGAGLEVAAAAGQTGSVDRDRLRHHIVTADGISEAGHARNQRRAVGIAAPRDPALQNQLIHCVVGCAGGETGKAVVERICIAQRPRSLCVATGAEVFAAAQDWVVDAGRAGDKVPADDVAKAHRAWAGCRAVGGVDRRDGRPRQGQLCDRVVSRRPGKAVVAGIGSSQCSTHTLGASVRAGIKIAAAAPGEAKVIDDYIVREHHIAGQNTHQHGKACHINIAIGVATSADATC